MLRCFALQHLDLNGRTSVDYREMDPDTAQQWLNEHAEHMSPGWLSTWCWAPQVGWLHRGSWKRTSPHTTTLLNFPAHDPPELLEPLPGEESALEFAPEDFSLN